jgi:hypothetical protein
MDQAQQESDQLLNLSRKVSDFSAKDIKSDDDGGYRQDEEFKKQS